MAEQGLPIVVPVVVSHAKRGWSAAVSIDGIYKLSEELRQDTERFRPRIEFILLDLAKMELQDIQHCAADACRILP